METLNKRLFVGPLRRPSEWVSALQGMFEEIARTLGLTDKELDALRSVPDLILFHVYAQLIGHVDLVFGDVCCRIHFNYDTEGDADDLDITPLQLGSWEIEKLELQVFVSDAEYANYLGADRILSLSSGRLEVRLVSLERDTELETGDSASQPFSEGAELEGQGHLGGGSQSSQMSEDHGTDMPPQDSPQPSREEEDGEEASAADAARVFAGALADQEEDHGNSGLRED